ncbi:MAG: type II toxin-antitoxin system Phd/YefM family antitoxin [Candidatus Anammoxibacter sp.]
MITVTSAEFQKQFGQFRELAQHEPVTVTSHGRDSVVLLSATEYTKLKTSKKGTATDEFKKDVADFMKRHSSTLEELAK